VATSHCFDSRVRVVRVFRLVAARSHTKCASHCFDSRVRVTAMDVAAASEVEQNVVVHFEAGTL
jgi:hypothetical protein